MMSLSSIPVFYWSYWASLIYIFGMLGYLMMDTLIYLSVPIETTVSCVLYALLAGFFAIDAIFYTIDWYIYAVRSRQHDDEPIHYRAELVACIFHQCGSYCYLIGAILAFDKMTWMKVVLLCNFIGILAFVFESCLTFLGWIVTLKRTRSIDRRYQCTAQVRFMWSVENVEIFLLIPSRIFICGLMH
jgi:hypothetical protein